MISPSRDNATKETAKRRVLARPLWLRLNDNLLAVEGGNTKAWWMQMYDRLKREAKAKCSTSGFVEKSDADSTDCTGSVCDAVTDKGTLCEAKAKCGTSGFVEKSDAGYTVCAGSACSCKQNINPYRIQGHA